MRSIRLFYFFSLLLFGSYSTAQANSHASATPNQTISLAALEFPPYSYTQTGSSECVGYIIELTRQIFSREGYTLEAICAPAIRVYRMIEIGDIDLTVNIKSTQLIQNKVEFIEPQYGQLELIFLTHKNNGFANMVSGIRGFDYNGQRKELVKRGFTFQDTPGSIDAIKMFIRGRTRHLITYKAPYKFYLEQHGFSTPLEVDIENLTSIPTFYAVSVLSPQKEAIKQILIRAAKDKNIERFEDLLAFY
ncbi:transporter substrate-binding domain-containing protein [Alteromonas flava]|uniref:transporter substrate-binding domain-containing protein n=1 Tax=Alteromonas flava TaxID=2048003 RepID=UPI000C28924B|nr:transporter substrate-binding domain-containing protein [Alteromonas flava]